METADSITQQIDEFDLVSFNGIVFEPVNEELLIGSEPTIEFSK